MLICYNYKKFKRSRQTPLTLSLSSSFLLGKALVLDFQIFFCSFICILVYKHIETYVIFFKPKLDHGKIDYSSYSVFFFYYCKLDLIFNLIFNQFKRVMLYFEYTVYLIFIHFTQPFH